MRTLGALAVCCVVAGLFAGGCRDSISGEPPPLVVLIGVDGATPEVIDELRSERKLPAFERLVRAGTYGPMRSLAARRLLEEDTRRRYASPILWTTIATGKVPEKHGIRDFVLPIQGTASVWMGSTKSRIPCFS